MFSALTPGLPGVSRCVSAAYFYASTKTSFSRFCLFCVPHGFSRKQTSELLGVLRVERRDVLPRSVRDHPQAVTLGVPATFLHLNKTSFGRLCPFCVPQSPHPKKTSKILNIGIWFFWNHLVQNVPYLCTFLNAHGLRNVFRSWDQFFLKLWVSKRFSYDFYEY